MKKKEWVEILDVHANGLREGVDLTKQLVEQKPTAEQKRMESLLALARRVHAALTPVEPRPSFVFELKAKLQMSAHPARLAGAQVQKERKRKLIWVAAGVGGTLYLISVMMVSLRLSWALFNRISGARDWQIARPVLPKPHLTP